MVNMYNILENLLCAGDGLINLINTVFAFLDPIFIGIIAIKTVITQQNKWQAYIYKIA